MNICDCAPRQTFDACVNEFTLGKLAPNTEYDYYFSKVAGNNTFVKVTKTTDGSGNALFDRAADFPMYFLISFSSPFIVTACASGEINLENTVDFTIGTDTYPCLAFDIVLTNIVL